MGKDGQTVAGGTQEGVVYRSCIYYYILLFKSALNTFSLE